MAYGVLVPQSIMATNLGSLNVGVVAGSTLENGMLVRADTVSVTSGYGECLAALIPTTGSLSGLYMIYSPEVITSSVGSVYYKGINVDPRNFTISASTVADAFRPQPGDIVLMSEDCFTAAKSSSTHANATVDQWQLVWGSSQTGDVTCFKYLSTENITIGSGSAIGDTHLTAYKMLCLAN